MKAILFASLSRSEAGRITIGVPNALKSSRKVGTRWLSSILTVIGSGALTDVILSRIKRLPPMRL